MSGKIIAVLSVTAGDGAKYVATNLAFVTKQKMKDNKNKKELRVLLIDFDFENPVLAYEYVKQDEAHSIDNIINSVSGGELTEALFKDNITHTKLDIDVLRGVKTKNSLKFFTKEIVEIVLKYALSLYDYVYVVVNPNASNAGTVYTLMSADKVVIVAKNNYTNFVKIEKTLNILRQYYKKQSGILMVYNINNLKSHSELNSKLINSDITIVGLLEYEEKGIDNINLDKKIGFLSSKSVNDKCFNKIFLLILKG